MNNFTAAPESIQIWAVTTAILFLKMYSNSALQGMANIKSKRFYFQEDADKWGHGIKTNRDETEFQSRATIGWENDLENVPIFLFLLLAFAFAGGEPQWCLRFAIAFTLGRIVHAVALHRAMQPLRAIAYIVGLLSCFGLCIWILVRVV